MKRATLLMFCLFMAGVSEAQTGGPEVSRLADELIGFQEADADYSEAYENLVQTMTNRINLNTATAEELRALYLLSETQIGELLRYRSENGALLSLYELQAVPGFDPEQIARLLPFVEVADPAARVNKSILNRMFLEQNSYLVTRYEQTLERRRGFVHDDPAQRFQGSADKLYLRFRTSKPGDFSMGITAEKDPGEKIVWDGKEKRYGPDFLSYHLQLKNKGRLVNIIAGDFQAQFGQGLILGGAFGLGKGAETITTARRANTGLVPFSSSNEAGFYRGIGATVRLARNIFLTGFYSSTLRDGVKADEDAAVSSFPLTGLHRNENELKSRKKVTETNRGVVVNGSWKKLETGVIFHSIRFGQALVRNTSLHNQFAFQGSTSMASGAFLNYTRRNQTFFCEAAHSFGKGSAVIAGLLTSFSANLDAALLYRRFDRGYAPFYGNAFSENTQATNEHGFYWGWKYQWKRRLVATGYIDLFSFPWIGFRRHAPSSGHEWLARLSYQRSKRFSMFVQGREEVRVRNLPVGEKVYQPVDGRKQNLWVGLAYYASDNLKFSTRGQFSSYRIADKVTRGAVLLHDVSYTFGKLQLTVRHALFETDDYDNRQYAYEPDVWLAFSLPAYYGVGVRNLIVLEYKVSKRLTLWARFARSAYVDREVIGAGLEEIPGNSRNDVKFQALIRF